MKTILETKTAVIGAIPANSSVVLFSAVIDGTPTAAQIDAARNTLGASLELVGTTSTSAHLVKFEPVSITDKESLVATTQTVLVKNSPDAALETEEFPEV